MRAAPDYGEQRTRSRIRPARSVHELVQHTGVHKTRAALPGWRGLKMGAPFRQSLLPGVTGCFRTIQAMLGSEDSLAEFDY